MPVWFFYVDESHDDHKFCLSAIAVRHSSWNRCFDQVKAHRGLLKAEQGIFIEKEIHARELVSGRGRISPEDRPIGEWARSRIFHGLLELVSRLPGVFVINVCLDTAGRRDPQLHAWEMLINAIEAAMRRFERGEKKKRLRFLARIGGRLSLGEMQFLAPRLLRARSRAFIVSDEGREADILKAIRKLHRAGSSSVSTESSAAENSMPRERMRRIIEDPVFKSSHRSHFLQLADCVAFALLKREVPPTPHIARYDVHTMFDQMIGPCCYRKATKVDPLGILR